MIYNRSNNKSESKYSYMNTVEYLPRTVLKIPVAFELINIVVMLIIFPMLYVKIFVVHVLIFCATNI